MKPPGKLSALRCLSVGLLGLGGLLALMPAVTRPTPGQASDRDRTSPTRQRSTDSGRLRSTVMEGQVQKTREEIPPPASRSRDREPTASSGAVSQRDPVANQANPTLAVGNTEQPDQEKIGAGRKQYALPLIYRLGDEEFLSHFPQMSPQVVDSLRSEFELNAGVDELAPDDPEYARRWEHAEMTLEERIRILYGWAAWGDYSRQLALESEADSVSLPPE